MGDTPVGRDGTLHVAVRGRGTPLVLLHGFTGSGATWATTAAAFDTTAQVIVPDLIGHARSAAPADPARYSMQHAVADLLALLDRLEARRSVVVGYSMGARLALHLAVSAPQRLAALVLESGSPGLADADERAARRSNDEALADRIERDGLERFVDDWERRPLFASQERLSAEQRAAQRRERLGHSALGLANSLRGMGTGAQAALWEQLPILSVPVTVVVGALDTRFTAIGQAMVDALPQARLIVVPRAGHAVHLESPGSFIELLHPIVDAATASLFRSDALKKRREPWL